MKRMFTVVAVFGLFWAFMGCVQGFAGLPLPELGSLPEGVKVKPSAQVGFQKVAGNINLPVNAEGPIAGLLQIDELDIVLKDANFWIGTAGLDITVTKMLGLFVSGGGVLGRQFIATGTVPVSLGPLSTSAVVDFTASEVGSWYIQTGASLGPILLGLYWDKFTLTVGEPRQGSVPLANQSLRGDFVTKTFAPYIGIAIPASNALATICYSPFAMTNTTVALRTSDVAVAQLQYKWNKPGNYISAGLQYNTTPVNSLSFGLWGSFTWMKVTGNANLEFENATTLVARQRDVSATMTMNVIQGGVTLSAAF